MIARNEARKMVMGRIKNMSVSPHGRFCNTKVSVYRLVKTGSCIAKVSCDLWDGEISYMEYRGL